MRELRKEMSKKGKEEERKKGEWVKEKRKNRSGEERSELRRGMPEKGRERRGKEEEQE